MTQIAVRTNGQEPGEVLERVVMQGDLAKLTPTERMMYYRQVCDSLGLNPLTRPFDYINLSGKLTLYAKRDCADQLRRRYGVSIGKLEQEQIGDLYVVTAYATMPDGRADSDMGAVAVVGLKGEALANAMLKAVTKAKRRVTLSICGLGMLDETEVEAVPGAQSVRVDTVTGEVVAPATPATSLPAPQLTSSAPPHTSTPVDTPATVTEGGTPVQSGKRLKGHAWTDLLAAPDVKVTGDDKAALRERMGQLLGKPVPKLASLTVEEIDQARQELEARHAARRRYYAIAPRLDDEQDRALLGTLLNVTITSRTLLTAAQWQAAGDVLESQERTPLEDRVAPAPVQADSADDDPFADDYVGAAETAAA